MLYKKYWGHQEFEGLVIKRKTGIPFNQTGKPLSKDIEHQVDKIWNKVQKPKNKNPLYGQEHIIVSTQHLKNVVHKKQIEHVKSKSEKKMPDLHSNFVKWKVYWKRTDYGPFDIEFDTIGISYYNDYDTNNLEDFLDHRSIYLSRALEHYSQEGIPLGIHAL